MESDSKERMLILRSWQITRLNNAAEKDKPRLSRDLRMLYDDGRGKPTRLPPPSPTSTPKKKAPRQPPKSFTTMKEIHRKAMRRKRLAWLLRVRGLTYRRIGERMGICTDRARQLVIGYSRYLNGRLKARHTKFYFIKPDLENTS